MGLYPHGDGEAGANCFPAARSCDYCESAAAMLFCRVDSAFFCIACDSKVHNPNTTKHERVWMCEVCEQAPALVACKADSAMLCSDCDRDIHSANPLSRRHERTPVVPFYENGESVVLIDDDFLTNSDSWIIPTKLPAEGPDIKSIEMLFSDSDQFLDFEISQQVSSHLLSDCVVPVQTTTKQPPESNSTQNYSSENRLEIDFTKSNIESYNNSYSVSSSTMDTGVVPDGNALSDISYPFNSVCGSQGYPLMGVDRKARVLRYREKRKSRRFQKTIRYASRKAYAETRPRIKGRFAKRTEGEPDGDAVFISGSCEYVF